MMCEYIISKDAAARMAYRFAILEAINNAPGGDRERFAGYARGGPISEVDE